MAMNVLIMIFWHMMLHSLEG